MKTKLTISVLTITLLVSLAGCNLLPEKICKPKELFLSGAVYQHEKDVILTTLRYIHIYSMLDTDNIEAKKELDWFIDLMIMELESNHNKPFSEAATSFAIKVLQAPDRNL